MTAPAVDRFVEIRDNYFLDPRDPLASAHALGSAAQTVIDGAVGKKELDGSETLLEEVATFLGNAYSHGISDGELAGTAAARDFNHLSVGQLHPSGNGPAILAGLASLTYNNNTIIKEVSALETAFEKAAVTWLMEHVTGYDPATASGLLVTGGTSANLHALLAARLRLEAQDKRFRPHQTLGSRLLSWTGLVGKTTKSSQAVLFGTQMGHYSLLKSAGILAPGEMVNFEHVPLERGGYRMDPRKLEKRIRRARRRGIPIMGVIAVAGETETGVVDDINAIADITEREGIYLHVDGAYGAPFRVSREGARLDGLERAHSVTIDPHKYGYTPYPGGAVLFRNAITHARIKRLNRAGDGYMFQDGESHRGKALETTNEPYLGERRIEGSMGGLTAAMVYTTLKTFGREGLAALLDHTIDMTHLFMQEMADCEGLVPAHQPELNTICYRPVVKRPWAVSAAKRKALDQRIEDVSAALEQKYGIYLKPTALPHQNRWLRRRGIEEKVFRAVFTHPYTGQTEVKYIADALKTEWEGSRDEQRTAST